ncbi:MAG: hypothetical protein ACFE8M_05010 [Candidatus Hermodarchaeota archaeon]
MEKTKEDIKRTFTPSPTSEPKQKRTNFSPSMELPKESKQRTFITTLDIDITKKKKKI